MDAKKVMLIVLMLLLAGLGIFLGLLGFGSIIIHDTQTMILGVIAGFSLSFLSFVGVFLIGRKVFAQKK